MPRVENPTENRNLVAQDAEVRLVSLCHSSIASIFRSGFCRCLLPVHYIGAEFPFRFVLVFVTERNKRENDHPSYPFSNANGFDARLFMTSPPDVKAKS